MTTLGHSLTGLALLTLTIPKCISWQRRLSWSIVYIALASVPDWPLPEWGHQQLAVSHSLWVNLALCTTLAVVLWKWFADLLGNKWMLWSGALAWLSHLGLDALYADLPGVSIYWPFSNTLASLPLPWLRTLPHTPPPFDTLVVQILFIEFLTFAPLILVAYGLRHIWIAKDGR